MNRQNAEEEKRMRKEKLRIAAYKASLTPKPQLIGVCLKKQNRKSMKSKFPHLLFLHNITKEKIKKLVKNINHDKSYEFQHNNKTHDYTPSNNSYKENRKQQNN